ncbi:thiamine pyrophosphate-binding protein [Paenibacillus yanchengensis]|uniref:Thiamine pyrophosphate-binding protein n=1 Tax=Paenibacillus yanchengensis TaxID=2035833 RepID=A0ABW4YNQ7_9BACL
MKTARAILEYLKANGTTHIFGIPAGSVNAIFDELYEIKDITPVVTKHEGAAAYMAASYAKYAGGLSVCIGCSGPGATNLVTGAASAMREQLPILFITGAVPVSTMGLNASQELDVASIFLPVTKYSVIVKEASSVLSELQKACQLAISGVPGPVHIALPIDVQHTAISMTPEEEQSLMTQTWFKNPILPNTLYIDQVVDRLLADRNGFLFVGQGIRGAVTELITLAELLQWPIVVTPQAKGYIPDTHPLLVGIFGFAGHKQASDFIAQARGTETMLIVGSSLGETATSNYNATLTQHRFVIQLDRDETVFNKKYVVDIAVTGDITLSLRQIIERLENRLSISEHQQLSSTSGSVVREVAISLESDHEEEPFFTKQVLHRLQQQLPHHTRFTIDIGEFMSYVIHHMRTLSKDSFDINVHFGAMGSGIGAAIGSKLAEPDRPVVCITGDGCFFMHGMEVLTAKEYNLNILFVVMNNARLGMVYHGHALQFKRTHTVFEQEETNIAKMAEAMGIPSKRISSFAEWKPDIINQLLSEGGPAVLEIALVDHNVPPMGDRVKFLSSFGK